MRIKQSNKNRLLRTDRVTTVKYNMPRRRLQTSFHVASIKCSYHPGKESEQRFAAQTTLSTKKHKQANRIEEDRLTASTLEADLLLVALSTRPALLRVGAMGSRKVKFSLYILAAHNSRPNI